MDKASSKKGASPKKGAPKGQKAAKGKAKTSRKKEARAGNKAKPARAKEASTPRAESKGAKILELIGLPQRRPRRLRSGPVDLAGLDDDLDAFGVLQRL
jgi:hypothetical protein